MTNQPIDRYPYEVRERAAIYEFDGGMTRTEADAKAINEYENQTKEKTNEQ